MLLKFATCDSKKSNFMKQQGARGLLSSLEIKAPSSETPINKTSFALAMQD